MVALQPSSEVTHSVQSWACKPAKTVVSWSRRISGLVEHNCLLSWNCVGRPGDSFREKGEGTLWGGYLGIPTFSACVRGKVCILRRMLCIKDWQLCIMRLSTICSTESSVFVLCLIPHISNYHLHFICLSMKPFFWKDLWWLLCTLNRTEWIAKDTGSKGK